MGLAYLEGRIEDVELRIETGLSLADSHQKNQLVSPHHADLTIESRMKYRLVPSKMSKNIYRISNCSAQSTERSLQ